MRKKGSGKTVKAFSLGTFVVSPWLLLLLTYPRLATNTLPSERHLQTLACRLHAQTLSKALLGFSLPHNLLMHGSRQPFSTLPYYIFLVENLTHSFLVGSLCLSSIHLQWRIDKMTQNWSVFFFFFSCNAIGNPTFPLWMCDHLHHWSLLFILPPCLFSPSSVRLWGRGQAYLPWEMPLWERDPAFPFCRQPWSLCVILLEIPSLGFGDEKSSLSRPLASPGSHPQFL